jgi:hypothetical protein
MFAFLPRLILSLLNVLGVSSGLRYFTNGHDGKAAESR